MLKLKKKFISIKNSQIRQVKELLDAMGVSYYNAEGEADNLCAWLTIKQDVYACLSDDMDMFAFGCPRILRYYNIYKGTMLLYDTKKILKTLNLTQKEFRELCVLSGSDYNNVVNENSDNLDCNLNNPHTDLHKDTRKTTNSVYSKQNMFNYYNVFLEHKNKVKKSKANNVSDFYEYLETSGNITQPIDYNKLINVIEMFDITKLKDVQLFIEKYKTEIQNNIKNSYKKTFCDLKVRQILMNDGFIFKH
jgi:hypothetical protein